MIRYQFDLLLGTELLLGPDHEAVERALMFEFLWSAAAGVLAGVVFRTYFRRESFDGRIPDDVAGEIVDPREGAE